MGTGDSVDAEEGVNRDGWRKIKFGSRECTLRYMTRELENRRDSSKRRIAVMRKE